MNIITIGSLIEKIRVEEKKISRKKLAEGICSEQMLYDIEKDRRESDPLIIDILLQRLGKSPNKLERILPSKMYYMIRFRDLLEKAILKGKKKLSDDILKQYPNQTSVDQMYRYRMQACLLHRINHDLEGAKHNLQSAISLTLPDFTYEKIDKFLISTIEIENLLALEQLRIESRPDRDQSTEKWHLEILMDFINENFTDEEEHAKIYSKCAWLLATIYFNEEDYMRTISLCSKGIEGLRRNAILYFMFPLLVLITEAEKKLGINPDNSKWTQYQISLTFLWDNYAEKWYPTDWLFHNCSQQEYLLDYELVRSEREAKKMTQLELSDGIYKNVESYSRFETGKVSPKKKTFEKLLEKLEIERRRYNSFAVTDSHKTMELRRNLDRMIGRKEYTHAQEVCENLKKELNMDLKENRQIVESAEMLIDSRLNKIPYQNFLIRQKELLSDIIDFNNHSLYHVPNRNEVLLINYYCVVLKETGQIQEATWIYQCALQKIKGSRINIKYRYLSYSLLLNNYSATVRTKEYIYEVLKNELLYGKISVLPFCLNNILHTLEREGQCEQECTRWAMYIYYISDLLYYQKVKEEYGMCLEKEHNIYLIH